VKSNIITCSNGSLLILNRLSDLKSLVLKVISIDSGLEGNGPKQTESRQSLFFDLSKASKI
jgi:hypothetical protein